MNTQKTNKPVGWVSSLKKNLLFLKIWIRINHALGITVKKKCEPDQNLNKKTRSGYHSLKTLGTGGPLGI